MTTRRWTWVLVPFATLMPEARMRAGDLALPLPMGEWPLDFVARGGATDLHVPCTAAIRLPALMVR